MGTDFFWIVASQQLKELLTGMWLGLQVEGFWVGRSYEGYQSENKEHYKGSFVRGLSDMWKNVVNFWCHCYFDK